MMKKIMIAVAIVCAAVASQAATANWKVSAANVYDGSGSTATTAKYSGTAYFFNADSVSQSALFALFAANTKMDLTKQTGYLSSGTVASGVINANTAANKFSAFEQGSGEHNFYFVLVDDTAMYLSATKKAAAGSTDSDVSITFGTQSPGSQSTTKGFTAAGSWAAVPEPTSGLLLLIGMAGLALRRRRA